MRSPYYIYRRGASKIYYAAIWDADRQQYGTRVSTGSLRERLGQRAGHLSPTSRAGARAIVDMWIQHGAVGKNDIALIDYLLDFWHPESDYVQRKADRGSISPAYIAGNVSAVGRVRIVLQSMRDEKVLLRQVTAGTLEKMISKLQNSTDLSPRRINAILQAVTVPLREAVRIGLILDDPTRTVQKLPEPRVERDPLTPDEVRRFFGLDWDDRRQYAINLLAATTGMRLGECRGLAPADVHDDWIDVRGNWQDGEGLKLPKGGKTRAVPIPSRTHAILQDLINSNPWKNEFVFYGQSQERPINKKYVANAYRDALGAIGLTTQEIVDRKLTFHSWRHWYNSMLRGRIEDHALRALTGHSSASMTDRYTEITQGQRQAVAALAENLETKIGIDKEAENG